MRRLLGLLLLIAVAASTPAFPQRELAGTAALKQSLERLNVLGTVLMIAAHPDDENTALLAYLARGKKYRTAYLSLTRGEGGQNLIGPEQGDLMGVIRTQELLAARRIDGAEQFFTRAIDFGYSKTAEETLSKWGREEVLSDIVWVIRKLRPDVIVLRFSGTPRDGHGHHQSSAMLAKEAFHVAADPSRFPEQLKHVEPWQAKRVFWNVFSFRRGNFSNEGDMADRLDLDTGEYDPVLGFSYAEIAGMSRSQHRSQGFGAEERKGSAVNSLVNVDGEPAKSDPMEGIDTSWNRAPGGAAVGSILAEAAKSFVPEHPEKIVPLLLKARTAMRKLNDPWAARKIAELENAIALASGLWLDVTASRYSATPDSTLAVTAEALNRSETEVELLSFELGGQGPQAVNFPLAYNQPKLTDVEWKIPAEHGYSQPYWLESPRTGDLYEIADPRRIGEPDVEPVIEGRFRVRIGGQEIVYRRPLTYRWVDRVRGELTRAVVVVPAVSIAIGEQSVVFAGGGPRGMAVELTANTDSVSGELSLRLPKGWIAEPEKQAFQLSASGERKALEFSVTAPAGETTGVAEAVAVVNGREIKSGTLAIDYHHIPPQTLSPPAVANVVRVDARNLAQNVGYVMGAGDDVPKALRQLGCDVTLLESDELSRGDLSRFDAIVTGVRSYNTRSDLLANQKRLLGYVEGGGTLVVQYNVLARGRGLGSADPLANLGPYPLEIGRDRVSFEQASMKFLQPDHPVLQTPNQITARDFEGWIQERGLYFASKWDEQYQPLWEAHDPGEEPLKGSTLYARHGKGVYIFTGLSFFRELPAGVPGAYRIFANFLSAGKALR